jgi:hypothetical protein
MASPQPGANPAMDAESQSSGIISAAVILVVVSTILVLMRLYTRAFILKSVGPEDITIGVSQVGYTFLDTNGSFELSHRY